MTDDYNPLTDPNIAHADINEASIAVLVRSFYGKAREDDLIGPIFVQKVADWEQHIQDITDFWCSVMLRTQNYHGRPLRPHLTMGLEADHFDRWIALFEETADDLCPPDIAHAFKIRARRIADSFEMAIATQNRVLKTPRFSKE